MTKNELLTSLLIVNLSAILLIGFLWQANKSEQAEVSVEDSMTDLCLLKVIQSGESISENKAGQYSYVFISTADGIEVYLPCKKKS